MTDGSNRIVSEGRVPFKGYSTWYRRVGKCDPGKYPLLLLHGGPGACHNYLRSLEDIADTGREVIFYDQLGCGNSTIPSNPDLYSAKLWEEELDVMREALNLDKVHILGQSWGGMLTMQYAISQPKGVISMIVASSPASIALWLSEANRLIEYLPKDMIDALKKGDASGEINTPEYKAAYAEYYHRHVCMMDPYPDFVSDSLDHMGESYMVMQGASEFVVTGKLKDWDVTEDLHKITIPTLLTSGVMDEATPYIVKNIYDRIPNCKWELLLGTHFVHVELREEYNRIVENFIRKEEQA